MTKNTKRFFIGLFLTGIIFLNCFSLLNPISAEEKKSIQNDDYFVYEFSTTATYRLYHEGNRKVRLTVSDNNSYPMLGTLETVKEESDQWEVIDAANTVDGLKLVPYIMNTTQLEPGIENCPYFGLNTSRSYIVENWVEDKLEFDQIGMAFADRAAEYFSLEFDYQYEEPNRADPDNYNDTIVMNVKYIWDQEYGVLLKQVMEIENLDDPTMDGVVNITLIDTSLWSLATGGVISGYSSVSFISTTFISILFVMVIRSKRIKKNKKMVEIL